MMNEQDSSLPFPDSSGPHSLSRKVIAVHRGKFIILRVYTLQLENREGTTYMN